MKKKYLKTIEDIEALRNTDTKIYRENLDGYFKFVNGVLCLYIEVEDKQNDIGKLGWFWDFSETEDGFTDVLEDINDEDSSKYIPKYNCCSYRHFRPLTPEEVEKYTGYKVVKEK